jgi:hypothetical protein
MKLKEMKFDDMGTGVEFRVNKLSQTKYMKIPECQANRRGLMAHQYGTNDRNAVGINFAVKGELCLIQSDRIVYVED